MQDSDERVEILNWLREYYPDAQIDELPRSLLHFESAMRRENCHRNCPGISKCPTYGYVMKPVRVANGIKTVFSTAGEQCQKGQEEKARRSSTKRPKAAEYRIDIQTAHLRIMMF